MHKSYPIQKRSSAIRDSAASPTYSSSSDSSSASVTSYKAHFTNTTIKGIRHINNPRIVKQLLAVDSKTKDNEPSDFEDPYYFCIDHSKCIHTNIFYKNKLLRKESADGLVRSVVVQTIDLEGNLHYCRQKED
jgi:hypothetical protein